MDADYKSALIHPTALLASAGSEAIRSNVILGRGVYKALVHARLRDAAERGTPVAVTQAGSMSRPILERLGFREVCRIHALIDEFDR